MSQYNALKGLLCLLFAMFFVHELCAQQMRRHMQMTPMRVGVPAMRKASVDADSHNSVWLNGVIIDSITKKSMGGSVVTLIVDSVATNHSTDKLGQFKLSVPKGVPLSLEVSFLGYKIARKKIAAASKSVDLGQIMMVEDETKIDAITVETRVKLFTISGDTIVYNPAAVRSMEGDVVLDVLTKMPGLEVKADAVKVMGESVERTYVNGKLIFGEDAMSALNYLETKHVTSIQLYEEDDEKSVVMEGESAKKRKVLNIRTRKPILSSLTGGVTTMMGADFNENMEGRHQLRYAAGGGVKYFSEQRQLSIDYMNDNVNMNDFFSSTMSRYFASTGGGGGGSGYQLNNRLRLKYSDKIGSWRCEFNYSFGKKDNTTAGVTQRDYFPTTEYKSRIYDDTIRSWRSTTDHRTSFRLEKYTKKMSAGISANFDYSDDKSDNYNGGTVFVNDELISRRSINNSSAGNRYNGSLRGNWSRRFKNNSVNLNFSSNLSSKDAAGWRVDTLATSTTRTLLTTTSDNNNFNVDAGVGYSYRFNEKGMLMLNYSTNYTKNITSQLAIDNFSGLIDSTLTQKHINNSRASRVGLRYGAVFNKLYVNLMLDYESNMIVRDERFPISQRAEQPFESLAPRLFLSYNVTKTENMQQTMSLGYDSRMQAPSLDQLMDRLDTENPLNLMGGNPDLDQSRTHTLRFSYNKMATKDTGSQSLSFDAVASFTQNSIVRRSLFFAEQTYLPQYLYYADAGSTLSTYENLSGEMSANMSATYSMQVAPIRSMFYMMFSFGFDKRPSYIGDQVVSNIGYRPMLRMGLSGSFSEKINMNLSSTTGFDYNKTSQDNIERSFNQVVGLDVNWNFLKRLYLQTRYSFKTYRSYSYSARVINTNMWDATLGCYVAKKRRGTITFSVYDILNRNENFTSSMNTDYISNSWRQLFSRYFVVAFSYKFNQVN